MGRSHKDIIDTGILNTGGQSTKKLISKYSYTEPNTGKTSLQVSNIEGFDGYNKEYSYDVMGNITKIKITGGDIEDFIEYKYKYDLLSRLVEEFNPTSNRTINYEYNLNNNIKNVTYYEDDTTTVDKIETYNYDTSYKDKLMSITTLKGGVSTTESIVYGSNHAPTNFLGKALTWQGRRLKTYESITYEYNDAGIRTSKTVDGVKTEYHLIGDKVGSLTKGTSKLFFHYNERDVLVGFEYNKENYFYSRDLTGIINTIIDKNGDVMVEYKYDAWGNWLNQETAAKTSIGETLLVLNPFIYKGYIYDGESSLYYLKSRYYSPKIRKFITPDSEIGDVGNIENYNLFAYCINNPVMYLDRDGNSPTKWWEWALAGTLVAGLIVGSVLTGGLLGAAFIGASIGGAISLGTQAISGELSWGQFALDIGVGALTGTIGASGISTLGSTIVGTLIGGASSIGSQLIGGKSFDEINWWSVGVSAFIGGAAGFIGGAGARNKGALFNSKSVIKAQNGVSGVVGRFAQGGYYSSARYAQAAFTRTMNALSREIGSQMTRFFVKTMITYGASTVANNIIMMFI